MERRKRQQRPTPNAERQTPNARISSYQAHVPARPLLAIPCGPTYEKPRKAGRPDSGAESGQRFF